MKRINEHTEDLKRDKNFAPTSIKFLKRRKRIRAVAVVIVAVGVGLLLWLLVRSAGAVGGFLGGASPVVAVVGVGLVMVRFVLKILSLLISTMLLILLILLLCGML